MFSFLTMAQPDTIKSGNKINDVAPAIPQKYSRFPLSYRFFQTQRFAEVTPHCLFETDGGFTDAFRCMADTSTLSLKAPLKTDIYQKRSNFFVPLQAILPRNWELVDTQPTQGDDVAKNVDGNISGEQLYNFLNAHVSNLRKLSFDASVVGDGDPLSMYLTRFFRSLIILEMFGSQGSLAKQLQYDFSHLFDISTYTSSGSVKAKSFDSFLEKVLSALAPRSLSETGIHQFEVVWIDEDGNPDVDYIVTSDDFLDTIPDRGDEYIGFRHFLDLARQNLNFYVTSIDVSDAWDMDLSDDEQYYLLSSSFQTAVFGDFIYGDSLQVSLYSAASFPEELNFNMFSAYQIICAHFFSSDNVDYIYSATLYRNLMQFYCDQVVTNAAQRVFSWNGLQFHYDALSGYYINKVFIASSLASDSDFSYEAGNFHYFYYDYLTSLFSFRHNLRYFDYFTGGRTRPLSIGNVGVAVNDGSVNVVDITIQKNYARWFNWAMRIGRKFSKQQKAKTGVEPRPDLHDPQWLSGTGDLVFPEQVQNTGADQLTDAQTITSNLKSNCNRYQFSYTADRLGYIICVTTYDIPRAYAFATSRTHRNTDRYERFNPMLQYNGSQKVYKSELGLLGDNPFAYQGRYMHYKQFYDIAAGGFVEFLPGFAFIADRQSGIPMQQNLNPTYIRSWNAELDPFFVSLTGYGLAAYFHFIVKNTNIINANRNMEYMPQLM